MDSQIEIYHFHTLTYLISIMCPVHKNFFLKFQSITTTKMHIALEAFPDTPWAFIFRQPVQTMMSHLDPQKGKKLGQGVTVCFTLDFCSFYFIFFCFSFFFFFFFFIYT